jgi:hypothetical protein
MQRKADGLPFDEETKSTSQILSEEKKKFKETLAQMRHNASVI